jgi:hypothetical protein
MWAQGLAHMSWSFDFFFHSLWLNFKPQAVCWYLSPRLGSHKLKFWIFFLFFVIELQTSSCLLISEPKAWLTWAEILIFLFHSLWLNFKPQVVCWYQSPKLGSHELKFWFFFSFFGIEFQTSNCLLKVSATETFILEPQAWLTWTEILIFFLHSLWLNFKPQAICWY